MFSLYDLGQFAGSVSSVLTIGIIISTTFSNTIENTCRRSLKSEHSQNKFEEECGFLIFVQTISENRKLPIQVLQKLSLTR